MRFYFPLYFDVVGKEKTIWILDCTAQIVYKKHGKEVARELALLQKTVAYIWNITHGAEITAVWNFKPQRWESPLVVEGKDQEEKACERDNNNNNINYKTS
jgi:hypothetical protein